LIGHAEVAAPVRDEGVGFFEGVGIEQEKDALAGSQLPCLALPPEPLLTSTGVGLAPHVREARQRI
jgi:hypothetical protein